jgi:hypothetical protein
MLSTCSRNRGIVGPRIASGIGGGRDPRFRQIDELGRNQASVKASRAGGPKRPKRQWLRRGPLVSPSAGSVEQGEHRAADDFPADWRGASRLFADSGEQPFVVTAQIGRAKLRLACEAKIERGAWQKALRHYRAMYPDRECNVVMAEAL